ncbi:hypothetical protein GCM10018987_50850 [Streptomyces cremeus]
MLKVRRLRMGGQGPRAEDPGARAGAWGSSAEGQGLTARSRGLTAEGQEPGWRAELKAAGEKRMLEVGGARAEAQEPRRGSGIKSRGLGDRGWGPESGAKSRAGGRGWESDAGSQEARAEDWGPGVRGLEIKGWEGRAGRTVPGQDVRGRVFFGPAGGGGPSGRPLP